MLVAIQIPFTDCRPFLEKDAGLLYSPNWADPDPGTDFIRHFGVMRPRLQGGIREWPGEGKFCKLARAIRFAPGLKVFKVKTSKDVVLEFSCAFRRFMADGRFADDKFVGSVASRLEIGLRCRRTRRSLPHLDGRAVIEIIEQALNTTVRLPRDQSNQARPLSAIGSELAALYLEATTRRIVFKVKRPEVWFFKPAAPLVIVEYRPDHDVVEMPLHARAIPGFETTGIDVSHTWIPVGALRCGVWLLGCRAGEFSKESLRRLRLNLFRLHSERESIKQILRLMGQKKIQIERGQAASERFQFYLSQSLSLLSRERRDGIQQSAMLEAAQNSEDLVTEGEATTLKQQLHFIRGNLRHNLNTFAEAGGVKLQIFAEQFTYKHVENEIMNSQTITISGSTINGNFAPVAAGIIQKSFNNAAGSDTKPEIKAVLEALHKAVAEMCKSLPAEKQERAASDLQVLSNEAVAKEPRRRWYELSASGLLEAAEAVGQVAAPVATAVKTLLGLLA